MGEINRIIHPFPSLSQVRELAPGFAPYVQASQALEPLVVAHDSSGSSRQEHYRTEPNVRAIAEALNTIYHAQRDETLQPPMPGDMYSLVAVAVQAVNSQRLAGPVSLEKVFQRPGVAKTAVTLLRHVVAYGNSNYGTSTARGAE